MKKKAPKDDLFKRAEPIRKLLQELLKDRVRTEADKEGLAAYLGKSKATVNKMLYEGSIGLDVWVNALIHTYSLDVEALRQFIKGLPAVLEKQLPATDADRLWGEVTSILSQKEKIYYGNLLKCSVEANRTLEGKKPSKK